MESNNATDDHEELRKLARTIKRLSRMVWILSLVVGIHLLLFTAEWFYPGLLLHRLIRSHAEQTDSYEGFQDWPLEKQIKTASVIVLSKWQKKDGELKCIISEILKHAPNTEFYYKVGDEFSLLDQHIENNTQYGDGDIIFFTGSPARFTYSESFSNNRIGEGDIPLDTLREKIHEAAK